MHDQIYSVGFVPGNTSRGADSSLQRALLGSPTRITTLPFQVGHDNSYLIMGFWGSEHDSQVYANTFFDGHTCLKYHF